MELSEELAEKEEMLEDCLLVPLSELIDDVTDDRLSPLSEVIDDVIEPAREERRLLSADPM
jgi:hypothetical protein